jgi:hypothetical protein
VVRSPARRQSGFQLVLGPHTDFGGWQVLSQICSLALLSGLMTSPCSAWQILETFALKLTGPWYLTVLPDLALIRFNRLH